MVRAVLNSVLDVIRQLINGVGFTTVSDCLSSLINRWRFVLVLLHSTEDHSTYTNCNKGIKDCNKYLEMIGS